MLLVLEHPPVYTRGQAHRARRPADGRGLVPRPGHRGRGHRPRRAGDLPRPRPAGRLPDHGGRAGADFVAHDGAARSSRRWPTRASRPRSRDDALHRRLGGRRARSARSACTCRDGVTTHGLAVNVDNDLQPFEWIVPCGIDHVRMTSVARETGRAPALPCFRKRMAYRLRRGVRAAPAPRVAAAAARAPDGRGRVSTRSRARTRAARACSSMGEVRPFRERKPRVVQAPGAGRPALPRAARHDRGPGPAHGLPGGRLPEHRRVLGARHRHVHDPRRHLHAPLRLLQRQDGQAHPRRSARAAARRAVGQADGPAPRGHHERRPRRPARPRARRLRRRDPLDPPAGAGLQGRGADARTSAARRCRSPA